MRVKCAFILGKPVLRLYQDDEQGLHYNVCNKTIEGLNHSTILPDLCAEDARWQLSS